MCIVYIHFSKLKIKKNGKETQYGHNQSEEKCNTGDLLDLKDWELEKETTFAFGYFKTISGHFFANYIFIFHKI